MCAGIENTHIRRLVDCMGTGAFAARQDCERKIDGNQARVGVVVQEASNDKLPSYRLMGYKYLFLQPGHELFVLEQAAGVVEEHGQPQPLVGRQHGEKVAVGLAVTRTLCLCGNGRRGTAVGFGWIHGLEVLHRPRIQGSVSMLGVKNGGGGSGTVG